MPIRIGDGIMQLETDGRVVATATERSGCWREVTYWPRFFNRNQAITALTVTELLESSRDSNAPLVAALRQELLNGPADQAYRHGPRGQGPGVIGPDRPCAQPPDLTDLSAQPPDSVVTCCVNNAVRYY